LTAGIGLSVSVSCRISGGPYSVYATAFISFTPKLGTRAINTIPMLILMTLIDGLHSLLCTYHWFHPIAISEISH
jgi:hypothetical protein